MDILEIVASPLGVFIVLGTVIGFSLWLRGPSNVFQRPPPMPTWYWIVYWTMPAIVIAVLWYQPPFTGLYMGTGTLVITPLVWRKSPPNVRLWVTLFLVALAMAVFWTTLFGWPF